MDRGSHSLHTIVLLFAMALQHDTVHLVRGNHECASINRIYGFYDDCKRHYSIKVWKAFTDAFNAMPVAAIVGSKILCMHGGLSPSMTSLDKLRTVSRPVDPEHPSLVSDVLWADPSADVNGWGESDRGVGVTFGPDVVRDVLAREQLDLICRAHQVPCVCNLCGLRIGRWSRTDTSSLLGGVWSPCSLRPTTAVRRLGVVWRLLSCCRRVRQRRRCAVCERRPGLQLSHPQAAPRRPAQARSACVVRLLLRCHPILKPTSAHHMMLHTELVLAAIGGPLPLSASAMRCRATSGVKSPASHCWISVWIDDSWIVASIRRHIIAGSMPWW